MAYSEKKGKDGVLFWTVSVTLQRGSGSIIKDIIACAVPLHKRIVLIVPWAKSLYKLPIKLIWSLETLILTSLLFWIHFQIISLVSILYEVIFKFCCENFSHHHSLSELWLCDQSFSPRILKFNLEMHKMVWTY